MDYPIQHKQRREGEGHGGNEPAQDVGPQRINVGVTELQRRVFDNGEDERALRWKETTKMAVRYSHLLLQGAFFGGL